MEKNREEKEGEILQAVGRILLRDGFQAIGINSIAKEAGCSKVLIYRYFGNLEGLFQTFSEKMHLLPQTPKDVALPFSPELLTQILMGQREILKENNTLKEIMKWELIEENPLTKTLAEQREAQGRSLMAQLPPVAGIDIEAIAALLSAGVSYLSLRSDSVEHFNGVELQSEAGWSRIEKSINTILTSLIHKE